MKNVLKILLWVGVLLGAQGFVPWEQSPPGVTVGFQPVFDGKKIVLGQSLLSQKQDSFSLQTLRVYLSHFVFLKNDRVVFEEKNSYHLLDLEDVNSLVLEFEVAQSLDFDQVSFKLGIDSLTHIAGAMGGDLDPTKGMFWTWQSGYINCKLEGFAEKSPARNREFQFHLGGYLAPFQSVQEVRLNVPKELSTVQKLTNLELQLDLAPFFKQVNWAKKHNIMSPSKEAVAMSKILANSFSLHAK